MHISLKFEVIGNAGEILKRQIPSGGNNLIWIRFTLSEIKDPIVMPPISVIHRKD